MTDLKEKASQYYPSEDGNTGPKPREAAELRLRRRQVGEIAGFIEDSVAGAETDKRTVNIGDENGILLLASDPQNIDGRGTRPMIIVGHEEVVPRWPASSILETTTDEDGIPTIELSVHSFRISKTPISSRRLTGVQIDALHRGLLGSTTNLETIRTVSKPSGLDLGRIAAVAARRSISANS